MVDKCSNSDILGREVLNGKKCDFFFSLIFLLQQSLPFRLHRTELKTSLVKRVSLEVYLFFIPLFLPRVYTHTSFRAHLFPFYFSLASLHDPSLLPSTSRLIYPMTSSSLLSLSSSIIPLFLSRSSPRFIP